MSKTEAFWGFFSWADTAGVVFRSPRIGWGGTLKPRGLERRDEIEGSPWKWREAMQVLRLMGAHSDVLDWVGNSVEIDSITPDAYQVETGYLFVALPGAGKDGNYRVHQALQRGAVAVLGE